MKNHNEDFSNVSNSYFRTINWKGNLRMDLHERKLEWIGGTVIWFDHSKYQNQDKWGGLRNFHDCQENIKVLKVMMSIDNLIAGGHKTRSVDRSRVIWYKLADRTLLHIVTPLSILMWTLINYDTKIIDLTTNDHNNDHNDGVALVLHSLIKWSMK